MDNECSNYFKMHWIKEDNALQLVPPHIHRRNKAKRAIQTFKKHLKAGLATIDSDFPVNEWDRLIQQAELTLNLLQVVKLNPKLSAWVYLFWRSDWMKTPVVPLGTEVLVHEKPHNRPTWSPNGEICCIIGFPPENYCCIKVYFQR